MAKELIKLKNVCATYNGKDVLENISLSINEGEFWGIVGPNGAGKSTLLKIMGGLIKPKSGSVYIESAPLESLSARLLAQRIGYMPQLNPTVFSYSCYDMVMIGRTPYLHGLMLGGKNDHRIVERCMRETDCYQFAGKDINMISAGERQRVFISRALATEPSLLLLDEPVASLDLEHTVAIYRLLKKLNENRTMTIITVSHNLNIISQFAERILVLDKGKTLASGQADEVLTTQLLEQMYGDSFIMIRHHKTVRPVIVPKVKTQKSIQKTKRRT